MAIEVNLGNTPRNEIRQDILKMSEDLSSRMDNIRLDEKSFVSFLPGYKKEDIERDLNRVYEKQSKFSSERESEIIERGLEAALIILAKENNWAGENSEILAPSVFDDSYQAADMFILEKIKAKRETAALGMTFDVTTSETESNMRAKVSSNLENSVTNNFSQPKYLLKNVEKEKQPRLPVGIFACSRENAVKLIEAVSSNDTKSVEIKSDFRKFFGHQLKMFLSIAIATTDSLKDARNNGIRGNATDSYTLLHDNLTFASENFRDDKIPLYLYEDRSYKQLEKYLREHKQEITERLLQTDVSYPVSFEKKKRPRIPRKVA